MTRKTCKKCRFKLTSRDVGDTCRYCRKGKTLFGRYYEEQLARASC